MSTIGSINIGKLAAIASPQVSTQHTQTHAKTTESATPQAQITNISQVAANSLANSLESDKKRGVQKPPRAEASFSSNEDEEHNAKGENEEEKAENIAKQAPKQRKGLDLKA